MTCTYFVTFKSKLNKIVTDKFPVPKHKKNNHNSFNVP